MDALPDALRRFWADPVIGRLLVALIGLVLIYIVSRVVRASVARYLTESTARYRTRKFITVSAYLVAVLFLAVVYDDRLGGLTVAFGVAGAGVAFALQEVIASVAGWLTVTFAHIYKIGDRIMLGGIKGDVIDIGVLRTTIFEVGDWVDGDLYNGRVVRVANSFVFKDPVFNYSGDFPFLWDEITVPIRFGSDRARMRQILLDAAQAAVGDYLPQAQQTWTRLTRNYVIEDAQVEPLVSMTLDENWMTFTLRYPVDYKQRRSTQTRLYDQILDAIEATQGGVSLAATGQEILLVEPSHVRVEVPHRNNGGGQPGGEGAAGRRDG